MKLAGQANHEDPLFVHAKYMVRCANVMFRIFTAAGVWLTEEQLGSQRDLDHQNRQNKGPGRFEPALLPSSLFHLKVDVEEATWPH